MKRRVSFIAILIVCLVSIGMCKSHAVKQVLSSNEERKTIAVEIDYGGTRPSRTSEAPWVKGMTALEILQTVAKVETEPVGEFVIVVSIDGVEGKRGEMGWYYTVDGKSADELAFLNVIDYANSVKWTYKKDICSMKVDR